MSDWQPYDPQQSSSYDPPEFVQATLARRRFPSRPVVLIGIAVLLVTGAGIAIVCGIRSQTRHNRVDVAPERSASQETAEATAAFNVGGEIGVSADVADELEDFFERMFAAALLGDEAFQQFVDRDRLFARVLGTGLVRHRDVFEQVSLKNGIHETLQVDDTWDRFKLVRVVPVAGVPDNVVAYTYCWSSGDRISECRWWLAKVNGQWKAYDWERLDLGLAESRERALCIHYEWDLQLQGYYDCFEYMDEALRQIERGNYDRAMTAMRRAESCKPPPEFEDYCLLNLGYNWQHVGEPERAFDCFERVADPTTTPGAFYGKAVCYLDRDLPRKTLEFITLYEKHVGQSPDVWHIKAEALSSLGREEEAANEYHKLLQVIPEYENALRSWADLLAGDKKHELIPFLEETDDPVGKAVEFAWSYDGRRNEAGLKTLLSFVEQESPNSAEALGLAGLLASCRRDHERAATWFEKAMRASPNQDMESKYYYEYLGAMVQAGKMLEAYEAAPDPDAAFAYVADQYGYGEMELTGDEFAQLVEAHRARRPDDPDLYFYAATALSGEREYEAAERELRAGLKKTGDDEDTATSFRTELADNLFRQGRVLEAYRTIEPAEDRFQHLAFLCYHNERPDALRELIAAHREEHADDVRIAYFTARLLEDDGRVDEAMRLYRKGRDELGDDDYLFSSSLTSAYIRAGRWEEAYRESDDPTVAFDTIAQHLCAKEDWRALKSLIATHRAAFPDDANVLNWDTEMLWQKGDYRGLVHRFTPPDSKLLADLGSWEQSELWEKVLRCYVRLGQHNEAIALAKRRFDEDEELQPLIIAYAAYRDRDQTRRWFEESATTHPWVMRLYQDEDVGEYLCGNEFRSMREKHPFQIPYSSGENVAVFLLDEPLELQTAAVRDRLAGVAGPGSEVLPVDVTGDETRVLVRNGPASIWAVMRSGPFTAGPSWWDDLPKGALKSQVDRHRAWLAVGHAYFRESDTPDPRVVLRVGDRLAGSHSIALFLEDAWRVIPWNDEARQALDGEGPLTRFAEMGGSVTNPQPPFEQLPDLPQRLDFNRRLFEAAKSQVKSPADPPLEVRFRLSPVRYREHLWIRVVRVEEDDGSYQFIGPLTETSQLVPTWSAGEYVALEEYEIDAIKQTNGDKTVVWERGENLTAVGN